MIHIDVKKLARFRTLGHGITGNRQQGRSTGVGPTDNSNDNAAGGTTVFTQQATGLILNAGMFTVTQILAPSTGAHQQPL